MTAVATGPSARMLEAIPTNFFSTRFSLQQENRLLGELEGSLWRDKARLELEDGTYELFRLGRYGVGDFVLEHDGKMVATARKPSVFRNRFEIEVLNRRLLLRKPSPLSRRFVMFDGDRQIGSINPLGIFTRRSTIDLPAEWPLAIRGFVFWLAFIIWKKQNAAAS